MDMAVKEVTEVKNRAEGSNMMDNVWKDALRAVFNEKKTQVRPDLEAEYGQMANRMLQEQPARMAQCILQEESPCINAYIRKLRKQLQQQTSEQMQALGVSPSAAGIVWAAVKNRSELPKASLCRREDVQIQPAAPSASGGVSAEQKQAVNARNVSAGIAAAGAVAAAVTCLVVPGWTGAAGIVKAAELVVVGAGAVGAVATQQRIQQINRIAGRDPQARAPKQDVRELVKQVCTHQCRTNVQIIEQWLDTECEALIAECERELAR